jgi:copper(I)-binding protein
MLRTRRIRALAPLVVSGVLVAGVVLAGVSIAGCSRPAQQAGSPITLLSAQVTVPNGSRTTDAYVQVQNNGPADQLISAHVSVGGHVALRSPAGTSGAVLMRTVPAIRIPAHSLVRLAPYTSHLLITDSGRMKAGTEITLTLVFAHAGAISAPAMVTNPETGGSSYFLN